MLPEERFIVKSVEGDSIRSLDVSVSDEIIFNLPSSLQLQQVKL